MRFAKLGEEVYSRQSELAGEELRLYIIIFFHTWQDSRKCNKTLSELCAIYNLDYDNSSRRLKILRQKKWLENTKKYIRPLVGFKTVNSTVEPNETVNSTAKETDETVEFTVLNCKNYSETDVETVEFTVSSIPYIEPFKDENFLEPTTSSTEKNLSKFSIEECLRYVNIRIERGEKIDTPHRFARWLHQTGNDDVFISAVLYPEPVEQITTDANQSETEKFFNDALAILRDVQELGDDVDDLKHYYAPEIWARLMEELSE